MSFGRKPHPARDIALQTPKKQCAVGCVVLQQHQAFVFRGDIEGDAFIGTHFAHEACDLQLRVGRGLERRSVGIVRNVELIEHDHGGVPGEPGGTRIAIGDYIRRQRLRRRRDGSFRLPTIDAEDIDRARLTVIRHREIPLRQIRYRLAVRIRHDDVDLDDARVGAEFEHVILHRASVARGGRADRNANHEWRLHVHLSNVSVESASNFL